MPLLTSALHGLVKDSTALNGLQELVLRRIIENDPNKSEPGAEDASMTQSLTEFMALIPNLPKSSGDSLLIRTAPPQALTSFDLFDSDITQSDLLEEILQLRSTLRKLSLYGVKLTSGGPYRTIFRKLERDFDLSYLSLRYLREQDIFVQFDQILAQMPFILERPRDHPAVKYFDGLYVWKLALRYMDANNSWNVKEDREEAMEDLGDLLEDGWVWVEHDCNLGDRVFQLQFDAEQGDDIKMWLGEVVNRHQMKANRWG